MSVQEYADSPLKPRGEKHRRRWQAMLAPPQLRHDIKGQRLDHLEHIIGARQWLGKAHVGNDRRRHGARGDVRILLAQQPRELRHHVSPKAQGIFDSF